MNGFIDALAPGASMLVRPVLQAGGHGQEFGSASTLGFVVLVIFFIAVAFLARSMAKHLKRAQRNLVEDDTAGQEQDGAEEHEVGQRDPAEEPAPPAEPAKPEQDTSQHKADA